MRRRIEIEPDDIPYLFDEQRIVRQLERLGAMRLQPKGVPDPTDRHVTQTDRFRHLARTPMRGAARRAFQRANDHLLHLLVRDRPSGTRPRFIVSPSKRPVMNRLRHLQTVPGVTCNRRATTLPSLPSAHARMMRARRATWGAVRDRCASESNRRRSSSVRISATLGRPFRMLASL